MAVKMLDHIGMVVHDIAATAVQLESALGLSIDHMEDFQEGLITIAFIPVGQGLAGPKIELLEPHRLGSTAWDFLESVGDGIEHVAFLVDDVNIELVRLQGKVPIRDQKARPGAGNMEIAFLEQAAISGLLAELVSPMATEGTS